MDDAGLLRRLHRFPGLLSDLSLQHSRRQPQVSGLPGGGDPLRLLRDPDLAHPAGRDGALSGDRPHSIWAWPTSGRPTGGWRNGRSRSGSTFRLPASLCICCSINSFRRRPRLLHCWEESSYDKTPANFACGACRLWLPRRCCWLCEAALACPTCKDNLAADPDAANLARGYYYSILFMLSMPPLILAGLSAYFYWEIRKARAADSRCSL